MLETDQPHTPTAAFLGIYPKDSTSYYRVIYPSSTLTTALLSIVRKQNSLDLRQLMNDLQNVVYIHNRKLFNC